VSFSVRFSSGFLPLSSLYPLLFAFLLDSFICAKIGTACSHDIWVHLQGTVLYKEKLIPWGSALLEKPSKLILWGCALLEKPLKLCKL
jgi:hypothetical protein